MFFGQPAGGDAFAAVRIGPAGGQKHEVGLRRVGKSGPDFLLLPDDHSCGGLGDRQPTAFAVCLVVVIDQLVLPVTVLGQAVERQPADLVGPSSGVDEQFRGCLVLVPVA
ncbi:hypothetical protein [Streptomyces sp. NPDC056670]|uniref:hypothetical protein n=1 Tax=Streptomyces sp. NPDC056670 TaxID=3345904 RepID=UPI0036BB1DC2